MKKSFTSKIKFWKVMKICAAQGMIAMILCTVAVAHNNYAQVLDKKVTLSLKEVSIEEALAKIEAVTDVKFFYSVDQLNIKDKISFEAKDRSLREILDELLTPYQVKYKVHEKRSTITLKRQEEGTEARVGGKGNLDMAGPYPAATITGKVTDAATQQPMAGVNVIVKGTTTGTTTDADGRFAIDAGDTDVLVFSFIGFKTFETQVNGRSVIEVTMEEDITGLQEVEVNAGYWKVADRERTGNISKVTAKEIQKQPVSNPLAALQGRVPGLEIIQQTGVPGGNFSVRIRGQNSIANGNDPLYIIDGVPYTSNSMAFNETSINILTAGTSPLNAISPADIESIEVLKDADATAIYGSRGANGVIIITTKRGQAGKTKVDFNFYSGAGKVASKMDLLSTSQYVTMRKEAYKNAGYWPLDPSLHQFVPDVFVWDTTRYTDWQKKLIGGTAQTSDAQLSVSGGDKYTQFSFGAGYHQEGTVFPGDNTDRRLSTHISLNNLSSNEKLKTSLALKYSINDTDLIKRDLTSLALTLPPHAPPLHNENGDLNWGTSSYTQSFLNPLSYLKTGYEATTKNLLVNAVVGYAILPNLELKTNMGYSDVNMNAITITPKSSIPPTATQPNESVFSGSSFRNWTVEPQLNWKPRFGAGRFDILIGTTFLDQTQEGLAQYAYGFTNEALMKNIGASSSRTLATNYYNQYRYHAGFGRVNYVYKEKYIINITGRRDGSSRFGPGKQFANFGAVGAAWIFSEEGFIKNNIAFLSFGKLRGSYGITGNDQLGNYQYLDTYTSSGPYQGTVALTPVRLANPDFAWETNKKFESGLELGFIKDRIVSQVSYYRNRSSNQLVGFALPPTTGFNTIQGNLPAVVQNKGVEIVLSTRNIEKTNFSWTTSFNLSVPHNKLVAFPNLEASPSYANTLVVGEPISIVKRYNYLGVDPQTGLYLFEDVNEDGSIDLLDQQTVKFIGQDFYGGLMNSFQYGGFQLDILFQFVQQEKRNYLSAFNANPGGGVTNQPTWVMDRWRNPGDNSDIQLFTILSTGSTAYNRLAFSTRSVSDASFVRLKNLSLSYSLPQGWLGKLHINNARIFIQGQNLFTLTKYKGLDPETGSNSLPPLKVLSGGFNVTF